MNENVTDVMRTILAAGFPVLYSSGWYLDQQVPSINRPTPPSSPNPPPANGVLTIPDLHHYLWEDTFLDFYGNDPMTNLTDLPSAQQQLVLGGEVWSVHPDVSGMTSPSP